MNLFSSLWGSSGRQQHTISYNGSKSGNGGLMHVLNSSNVNSYYFLKSLLYLHAYLPVLCLLDFKLHLQLISVLLNVWALWDSSLSLQCSLDVKYFYHLHQSLCLWAQQQEKASILLALTDFFALLNASKGEPPVANDV